MDVVLALFQDTLVDLETAGIVAGGSSLLVFPILFVADQLLSQEANSSTSSDAASSFARPPTLFVPTASVDHSSDQRCSSVHLIGNSKAWSPPVQEAVFRTLAATMGVRDGGWGYGHLLVFQ